MLGLLAGGRVRSATDGGDLAVSRLGELLHLVRLDIASDDQERVIRRVEALVEGERILAVEPSISCSRR